MNVVVIYSSNKHNTLQAAEHVGASFLAQRHAVAVRPCDGLDYGEISRASLLCVGSWVQGILRPTPGDMKKLRELPMLWDKPTAAFLSPSKHAGTALEDFTDWLATERGANVITGHTIDASETQAEADHFVNTALRHIRQQNPTQTAMAR